MLFTVTREGEVKLRLLEGNQCGLSGDHTFRYEWSYASVDLDERNFVVDHHEVAKALLKWSKTHDFRGSCEQVVVAIGNIVLDHVHVNPPSGRLTVKLSGSVAANIKVEGEDRVFRDFSPKLYSERRKK